MFNFMVNGELIVGDLVEDDVGVARAIFNEVFHVEHPGEDATGGELTLDPFFHDFDHVVTDELYGIEFGREDANGAIQVEHGFAQ